MPRPERPLDPADGPVSEFAAQLRELRQAAGNPGYRRLAQRAHYSAATLAAAASGRRLPSLEVTLAFVDACGGDREAWRARWRAVAAQVEIAAPAAVASGSDGAGADAPSPYRGLAAYQPEDARWFFGRERLVADLLDRLSRRRFLAVFGPSGCGKSSLLRAGLLAAIRDGKLSDDWTDGGSCLTVLMTPGGHPLAEFADQLSVLGGTPPEPSGDEGFESLTERALTAAAPQAQLVLVVDQFEEIFTLCTDAGERTGFVAALLALAGSDDGRTRVVIGVRADFYAACATIPDLVAGVRDAQVLVGAMTPTELREAIVRPAEQAGAMVEGALVSTVVAEVAGRDGGLPLMSHALLEAWRRRRGNALTLAGYQAAGGVRGALAQTAEAVYLSLDADQRRTAQAVLARLVTFGDGVEDSRRRVDRAELDLPQVDAVLQRLADARLIILGGQSVEVAHEALISAWPRLRQWLSADREGLRIHRQLTDAATIWTSLHHDPGALYRGTRLAAAREWAANPTSDSLNPTEQAFLDASIELQRRELAGAARRTRQLRYLAAGLAVLLLIVTGASIVAIDKSRDARHAQQVATSRQLAGQALALTRSAPDTAMLLAAQAYRIAPTVEARGALLSMAVDLANSGELAGHHGPVSKLAFAPDGHRLYSVGRDRTLRIWDTDHHHLTAMLTDHHAWLKSMALSPDGHTLATGGDDHRVVLWDANQRRPVSTLTGHTAAVNDLAFSPDGTLLASAGEDDTVMLWNVATRTLVATLAGHTSIVNGVAFSPDGRTLASVAEDGTVLLWDTAQHTRLATLTVSTAPGRAIAFSPDGRLLATGGGRTEANLWDLASRTRIATVTHGGEDEIMNLKFSPDGRTLATAGHDQRVLLWDVRDHTIRGRLIGHNTSIYALAFSPDGSRITSAGEGNTITVWNLAHAPLATDAGPVTALAYRPDGQTFIAASGPRTTVWDTTRRTAQRSFTDPQEVTALAVSPDGHTVATAPLLVGQPGQLTLRDLTTGTATTITGHTNFILGIAFSPDGRTIATGSADHSAILWDITTRARLAVLTGPIGPIQGLAFTPDGHTLVTASHDSTLTLWDAQQYTRLASLPGHTGWIRAVAISPDGRLVATADTDQTLIVWDPQHRTRIATITDYRDGGNTGIAFSPDSHSLAYTSTDNTVVVWDVQRRAVQARLAGHTAPVRAIAYSPDGTTIISGGDDQTINTWNTNPQRTATQICNQLGRNLTHAEWHQYIPDLPYQPTCPDDPVNRGPHPGH
jgi:WD40 repeat protein